MLLAREIADVDLSWFEKIGYIQSGVLAAVTQDQVIALKGVASHPIDHLIDCQNTAFLHLDGSTGDVFEPGWIYRYQGDEKAYRGQDFVELKCEVPLPPLTLLSYFLVPVVDCEFAINDEDTGITPCTFPELWKDGFVKRVN